MLDVLLFAVSVTAPIFIWIVLGACLKFSGLLNDLWVSRGSWFVFYVSLPVLMFTSMVRQPLAQSIEPQLTLICVSMTLMVLGLSRRWCNANAIAAADATVLQQGALRGNLGIIGISLCLNAYGEEVFAKVSLLMALVTIVYNVLCVFIFVERLGHGADKPGARMSKLGLLKGLLTNPLIVAILAGLPLALMKVQLPAGVTVWTDRFVAYTLPIALIAIGATLSYHSVKDDVRRVFRTATLKLLVMPLGGVVACLLIGARGSDLGVVFLLLASPTAAASFIMAKAYGGNAQLAANIVVITTLMSLVTVSVGVFVLTFLTLM